MMTKNADKKREQMLMFCMDDMVPQNHMLRLIDKAIDWTFIYDLVEDKYCLDNGATKYGSCNADKNTYDSIPLWNQKYETDHERNRS